MAKKQAGKVIQMLSPENYIRTKARALPIYECLVNAEWQEGGIANIMIARSHINGNKTVCFYLVDIFCLGVKETHYMFNISKDEYQEVVSELSEMEPQSISYALAHNIIYAALEFAEEFGFKPHKDFTSVTRFMLEEDNEEVELIEVECGKDGKPLYISNEDDSEQKINSILKQLEKTAGRGNFEYIREDDDDEFDEDDVDKFDQDEEGEDDLEDDKFAAYTFEQKKQLFLELSPRLVSLKHEDLFELLQLSNSILGDIVDVELIEKHYDEYSRDLNFDITDDIISDELLGIAPGSVVIDEEIRKLFYITYFEIEEKTRLGSKLLKQFKEKTQDIPASYFLELQMLYIKKSSKYTKRLKEYADRFPDYPLICMLQFREWSNINIDPIIFLDPKYSCKSLFHQRNQLHTTEIIHYILFMLAILSHLEDPSRILAFVTACEELNFQEKDVPALTIMFEFAKTIVVKNHLTR